jgi:hypothetical protein
VAARSGIDFVSADQIQAAAQEVGLHEATTEALVDDYESAQLQALKLVFWRPPSWPPSPSPSPGIYHTRPPGRPRLPGLELTFTEPISLAAPLFVRSPWFAVAGFGDTYLYPPPPGLDNRTCARARSTE